MEETLEYLPGDVPVPPQPPEDGWVVVDDRGLASVARLLHAFHVAASSFTPPSDSEWQGGASAPFDGIQICHNDPVVGNVVFREGLAVALIDFDYAGPSDPLWDLAILAQHWVPLGDPIDLLDPPDDWSAPRRLRLLCENYGFHAEHAERLLDAVEVYLDRGRRGVERRVTAGEPAFVAYWTAGLGERLTRALAWVRGSRRLLLDLG